MRGVEGEEKHWVCVLDCAPQHVAAEFVAAVLGVGGSHVAGWRHIFVEGVDRRDLEFLAGGLHEEGDVFGEVWFEEASADTCDDLDEYGSRVFG